jgi:hypothetical protein
MVLSDEEEPRRNGSDEAAATPQVCSFFFVHRKTECYLAEKRKSCRVCTCIVRFLRARSLFPSILPP